MPPQLARGSSELGALVSPGGPRGGGLGALGTSSTRLAAPGAARVLDTVDTTGDGIKDSVVLDINGAGGSGHRRSLSLSLHLSLFAHTAHAETPVESTSLSLFAHAAPAPQAPSSSVTERCSPLHSGHRVAGNGLTDAVRKIEWRTGTRERMRMHKGGMVSQAEARQKMLRSGSALVDTTGDGKADTLALDTTGDGYVDTLRPMQPKADAPPTEHTAAARLQPRGSGEFVAEVSLSRGAFRSISHGLPSSPDLPPRIPQPRRCRSRGAPR